MMVPLNVTHLLASYGYGAVVLFVTLESTGIPLPGETMLLVAAIAAGTTSQLSIGWVIVAAASGAILGDNLGFWIGREAGFRIVRRYGRFVRLDERKLKLGHYLFLKHGGKVVFFGRFVTVLRTWAAFLAGTNQMLWPRFLLFNALGGLAWASLMGLSGYWLGDTIHRLTGPVGISVAVLAGLLSLALLLFVRRHQRRLEEEAERVLPGPWDAYWEVRRGQRPSRPRAFRMPGRREHAHPRERERSGEAHTMGDHVGQAFTHRQQVVSMLPRTSGAECHAARNTIVHKITLIPVPKETVVHE